VGRFDPALGTPGLQKLMFTRQETLDRRKPIDVFDPVLSHDELERFSIVAQPRLAGLPERASREDIQHAGIV
jgi:hypothetical protein